jgi:hypothetical protein
MKLFSMLRYKNMAEVGCLKDGNFQNLEASSIMLGSSSLVAPLETTGKTVFDTVTAPAAAVGAVTQLTAVHLNSIYYITAARAASTAGSAATIIRLPDLTGCSAGDKITFFVAVEPDTISVDIMQAVAADKVYGALPVYTACGNAAVAGDTVTVAPFVGSGGVRFIDGVTGANIGSTITFTCVGGTTKYLTADTTPATSALATPTLTTAAKNWHVSGFIVGDTTAMTGAAVVQVSA